MPPRIACAIIRAFCALSLPAIVLSQTPAPDSAKSGKPDLGPMRKIEFDTDEGTWTNVDVSPDGRTIIFDLLGDLYTLPIEGGEARLLLGGRAWEQMPRYSPDGKLIAFLSDRDGLMNLWIANADGSNLKQISKENKATVSSPSWSQDSRFVAASIMRAGVMGAPPTFKFTLFHKDGGTGVDLPTTFQRYSAPSFSRDGRFVYFSAQMFGAAWQVQRLDRASGEVQPLTVRAASFKPVLSPDGKLLVYGRRLAGVTTLRTRDLRSGAERQLVARLTSDDSEGFSMQDALPNYAFTPDGGAIIVSIDGKLQRVDVASGAMRAIPFHARVSQDVPQVVQVEKRIPDGDLAVKLLRWTTLSPDGRSVAFSALGALYTAPIPSGQPRRVTSSGDLEYGAAFSPDGKSIAYTTWTDTAAGHVMVASIDGKNVRRVTSIAGHYANPSWSPDGTKLAFVRGTGMELRQEQPNDDAFMELVWVPVSGGEPQYVTSVGNPVYALRHHAATSWSRDGARLIFVEHFSGPAAKTGDWLVSVRLDGTDRHNLVRMRHGEEMVLSPNGTRMLIGRRDDAWIAEIPSPATATLELNLAAPAVPVKRVSEEGAIYLNWLDDSTAMWSFGNRVFRYRVGAPKPEQIGEVSLTVPRSHPTGVVAFTNARIVTMRGDEVIERGTIVVTGNHITAVGASGSVTIPGGARVVDASGKTIIPGIIDVHAHMHYAAYETFPKQKWEYLANLAYGVTTTFDPSANSVNVFAQAEMVEAGVMLGPRIFSSGDVVLGDDSPGGVEIKGIEDARRVVRRHKQYGTEMLKQYMQPRRDARQWLAQAAREEGLAITAEGGSDQVLDFSMVADGYTAFEHSLPLPLQKDAVQFLAKSGTHYTPTLIVSYGGPPGDQYFHLTSNFYEDAKLRRFTPEDALARRRRQTTIPENEWAFRRVAQSAARVTEAGGLVSLGAHGNRQGLGAHWELWMLKDGGISAHQALREATLVPAMKLGRTKDIGSIEAGKFADFLVLDANPLDDIRNSGKIRYTVSNGFVYDAESLTRVWPDRRPLARSFWQTDGDVERFKAAAPKWPQ